MAKNNDTPKDLPILIPTGKRLSLKELAETAKVDETVKKVLGSKIIPVAAFNSSI